MKEAEENEVNWEAIVGLAAVLVVIWLAVPMVFYCATGEVSISGQVGDTFGTVNALFSAFALGGVVVAIILQTKELRESRIATQKSASAQEEQTKVQDSANKLKMIELELQLMTSRIEEANREAMWHREFMDNYMFGLARGDRVSNYEELKVRHDTSPAQLANIENALSVMTDSRAKLTKEILNLRESEQL